MKSTEEIVDLYLTKGWSLIPLLGKKRITKEEENVDIRQYYTKFDKYNIGLLTGGKSGIIVIDCDRADNDKIKSYGTRCSKTPNGWHYFFKWTKTGTFRNGQDIFNTRDKGYQVDVRGEGGYVVVPPSKGYEWANNEEIKELPDELSMLLNTPPKVAHDPAKLPEKGERHMWFLSKAGRMAKRRFTQQEAELYLLLVNKSLDNPLEEQDCLGLIDRAYSAEQRSIENDGYLAHIQELQNKKEIEFTTGIEGLDKISWGIYPGCLHVWVAYSQTGKTAIALRSAVLNAKKGKRVLFFPTESNKLEVEDRIASMFGNVDAQKFVTGEFTPEEIQRIKTIHKRLNELDFFIADMPQPTYKDIEHHINKYNPDIVYIDFFQRCRVEGENWQTVRDFARDIKDVAKKNSIPILVLSQVNSEKFYDKDKSRWQRADCTFWNTRGGESIGHEADAGLSMNKYKNSQGQEFVKFMYEKSRKTRKGTVYTKFDGKTFMFTEISELDFETGISL